jgi:hypothetical protein
MALIPTAIRGDWAFADVASTPQIAILRAVENKSLNLKFTGSSLLLDIVNMNIIVFSIFARLTL